MVSCSQNNSNTTSMEVPLRSDIDAKYKWDLTAV